MGGALSRDDFKASIEAEFDRIDTEGNGALTQDQAWEYYQHCARQMGTEPLYNEFTKGFDTWYSTGTLKQSKDGKISREELHRQALGNFDKF